VPDHPRALEQAGHHIVGYRGVRDGKPLALAMTGEGETLLVRGRHRLALDDGNAYLAAGLAGLGVLWLPHYMAAGPLAEGQLVALFEGWQMAAMPLYLAYPPNRHISRKLRVFMAWVDELMAAHVPNVTLPFQR